MIRQFRTLFRDSRCVAAVEFALISPTLIMAFAGTVDLGNAIYTRSKLEQALSVGANYALKNAGQVNATNGATLASTLALLVSKSNCPTAGCPSGGEANSTITINNGPAVTRTSGTSNAGGTAINADSCYCPTGSPGSWTWGSAVTCNNACNVGVSTAGKFVTISVSYTFTPFFTSYGFVSNGAMTVSGAIQTQ